MDLRYTLPSTIVEGASIGHGSPQHTAQEGFGKLSLQYDIRWAHSPKPARSSRMIDLDHHGGKFIRCTIRICTCRGFLSRCTVPGWPKAKDTCVQRQRHFTSQKDSTNAHYSLQNAMITLSAPAHSLV